MKKRKNCMISNILALTVLLVIQGGCGRTGAADVDVSETESLKSEEQEKGLSGTESTVNEESLESAEVSVESSSEDNTERVDNPDGGWTISEYGEAGETLSQSVYDADGKQIRKTEYSADGSIRNTTEYEYNETGELDTYVTYVYNIDGIIVKAKEYNSAGKRTSSTDYKYNDNGDLIDTLKYVDNKRAEHVTYQRDGSVAYYEADFVYDTTGCRKYKTYRADESIQSETEFNTAGQMVKYTSYYYKNHDINAEIAGYVVREYDDDGNIVNTEYFGIEPTSELLNPTLSLQLETEHFMFYCTRQDVEVLEVMAETLENSYDKVTSDLGKEPSKKTDIYISPTLMSYHNAIGRPDDPDWSVGQGGDGCFYMLSPLNPGPEHTYVEMIPIAMHEFTHVVVSEFNRRQPSYLNEGIACYEAGQTEEGGYFVQMDREAGTFPSIEEMKGWESYVKMSDYDSGRAYEYGGVYVNFAVETFGLDVVVSLLEGKSQTEAFGMSMEELNEKWMDFLASY